MIEVKRAVVHQLIKNDDGSARKLPSARLLTIDNRVIKIVKELEEKYTKSSQTLAVFEDPDDSQNSMMKHHFEQFYKKQTDDVFYNFSHDTSEKVLKLMKNLNTKDGYLLYAHYKVSIYDYVAIFFIRNKDGVMIQRNDIDSIYQLDDSIFIDTAEMAMAARISMNKYNTNQRYLSFIGKRAKHSSFFKKWICANETAKSLDQTKVFNKLIASIDLPVEDGSQLTREQFRNKVVDFVRAHKSEIDLRKISDFFYNDSEYMTNYTLKNQIDIDHQFKAHAVELKRLVNLQIVADKIRMNFPLNYLDSEKITYNLETGTIVIDSPELIQNIISERAQYD
ncbi:nucleoid-associated protein [Siphonobacter sp. SORGH_AS_0500]|uniref:nucleoid-associated protein n=1 Tax=Siphonobacter sp. SORGH_AS_0500 TaxID=1864824 RepID=UPI00285465E6|nr:nucleoid-associated protein [Siphonobacter sp. SORGH_AS_0500]MDR6194758.1 nucleoid-associated protein YejK [Siphonobacter sp. SORGH_AS_0500]